MQSAVEPYSLVLEHGSVTHCSRFGKPQELRNSLLAKSATLYRKVDTPAQSCRCRLTSLFWDQSSFNQKSKWRPEVGFLVKLKEWSCYFSKLDAQDNFHLKIQKGVQHIMAGADVPSGILLPLWMTDSRVLWDISPEHSKVPYVNLA